MDWNSRHSSTIKTGLLDSEEIQSSLPFGVPIFQGSFHAYPVFRGNPCHIVQEVGEWIGLGRISYLDCLL